MAISSNLISTALQLANVHQRRPCKADLRRSISTSYYALFHGLAALAAGRLVASTIAESIVIPNFSKNFKF